MNKATFVFLCLVFTAIAHKDKNLKGDSIYQPFTDVPKPNQISKQDTVVISEDEEVHDHQKMSQDRKKQYEDFNQMLAYGLIFGTLLLACMLMKTCAVAGRPRRVVVGPATQPIQYNTRQPMLPREITSNQIRGKIQSLKTEIKRLQKMEKQIESSEKMAEERQKEARRQQQVIKGYYNQVEMPRVYYNQYQNYESIPVGRPLPKDNDSSFASEYPTL